MSDYAKIKQTPEYREAHREVQAMINRDVQPLARHVDEIGNAVRTLEEHPKAFTMIFAAIFGALSDNPEVIRKIIDNLKISMRAAEEQNAHPAIRAEMSKALIVLDALASTRN